VKVIRKILHGSNWALRLRRSIHTVGFHGAVQCGNCEWPQEWGISGWCSSQSEQDCSNHQVRAVDALAASAASLQSLAMTPASRLRWPMAGFQVAMARPLDGGVNVR